MWTDALTVFLDNYEPVAELHFSSHQFSTQEIAETLTKHTGEEINLQELTKALNQMGYRYMRTGERDIEWLFKEVKDY